MRVEESKDIRLLDKDENVLCSLEAIWIYDDEDEEDIGEFYYIHPMTSDYCEFPRYCLQGWSEVDAEDDANWEELVRCIEDDCYKNLYYELNVIDYYKK